MKLSTKWKNWVAILDSKICNPCKAKHGKICEISEEVSPSKLHPYCRCTIQRLKSLFAGEATDKGMNGADWHLKHKGKLPEYYIDRITAKNLVGKSIIVIYPMLHRGVCCMEGCIKIKILIFLKRMEEYGMKQILIMNPAVEIQKG